MPFSFSFRNIVHHGVAFLTNSSQLTLVCCIVNKTWIKQSTCLKMNNLKLWQCIHHNLSLSLYLSLSLSLYIYIYIYSISYLSNYLSSILYLYIYIYIHMYIVFHIYLSIYLSMYSCLKFESVYCIQDANFIKHNRHFMPTYSLLDPFEFPYYFYSIRGELI